MASHPHPAARVHVRKEALKFAAAHMTVFPDGTKERLHGHNYRTAVSFDVADLRLKKMIAFSEFKAAIRGICEAWDERVLLAADCPFMKVRAASAKREVDFVLCGKHYVLPAEDVVFLPLDNVTVETLASEFCRRLVEQLRKKKLLKSLLALEVTIEESTGQGATCYWSAAK